MLLPGQGTAKPVTLNSSYIVSASRQALCYSTQVGFGLVVE